jgi:hypothetical protein
MSIVALDGHFSVIQDPSHASLFTLQGWVPQYPSTTRPMNISIKLNSLYGDVPMAENVRNPLSPLTTFNMRAHNHDDVMI